jgi:hypothetical protein
MVVGGAELKKLEQSSPKQALSNKNKKTVGITLRRFFKVHRQVPYTTMIKVKQAS